MSNLHINLVFFNAEVYTSQIPSFRLANHPEVYDMFKNGFHIIQQSGRYWEGVSSDMLIEQTFM